MLSIDANGTQTSPLTKQKAVLCKLTHNQKTIEKLQAQFPDKYISILTINVLKINVFFYKSGSLASIKKKKTLWTQFTDNIWM